MRLIRLKLGNWRGIETREIDFAEGVTIIEGPNESGKTSIVEALFTLINEYDSSAKQAIKSIQPVGRDVGSTVEAEIQAGEYRFIYSKTFNRDRSTSLRVLEPVAEQLTGRDAHARVVAMLEETVDLDLWKALLVDQGEKVAPANLKDSAGLSNALDEAAGGTETGEEDSGLYEAARAEYEKHFTLKRGDARFADLEGALARAEEAVAETRSALTEVERDALEFERTAKDIRRRQAELPELEASLVRHGENKQSADRLGRDLELRKQELKGVEDRLETVERRRRERKELLEAITTDEQALADADARFEPLKQTVDDLEEKAQRARRALEERNRAVREARQALEIARADMEYLRRKQELAGLEKIAAAVRDVSKQFDAAAETANRIAIDPRGMEDLRAAESEVNVLKGRRDLAATRVEISAERDLEILVDGESEALDAGSAAGRSVAASLEIRLPGIVAFRIEPPRDAADLDAAWRQAEEALARKLAQYGLASLEDAVRALAEKQAAENEIRRLQSRLADLTGDRDERELGRQIAGLRQRCQDYVERRGAGTPMPGDQAAAEGAQHAAAAAFEAAEHALESDRKHEADIRSRLETATKAHREAQTGRVALDARLNEKRRALAAMREELPDEDLDGQAAELGRGIIALRGEVEQVARELDGLSPDAVETLYANAQAAVARAKADLASAEREHAVLADRLDRARADGRYEDLEAAERHRDETRETLETTRRRAAAARRLWETLNRHRDAARQAYVRPLKQAIERLGRIVFGAGFKIALADDWTLESRTFGGVTLPWESLSVGAKEQLGILTRLAAARIVSAQGGVPLIIDDALGFSDPDRLQTMGAAIAAAGRDCQVIILTCTPGRFSHVGNAALVGY